MFRLTAILLCLSLLCCGCSPQPAASPLTVAEPSYPDMAPYPNESDFLDIKTGVFDDEGFSQAYDAWRGNGELRSDIPQGYADSLKPYFRRSIPEFLSAGAENAVCSPLNIYMALAMLAESTAGTSRQEILDLLNAQSIEALRSQARQIWTAHYCDDGASSCVLANSLWLDNGPVFHQETADRLARDYYASTFQGDLGSHELNRMLRDWLNEQTGGLLREQVEHITLDPGTLMALASTIYYRAKWSSEFQPENNTDSLFHSPSGKETVTFMNRTLLHGVYFWEDDFGAISLRLEDGSRMWLFLPDEGKFPSDLLAKNAAMDLALGGWLETENQKTLRINLSMPKFDVTADTRLNDSLKALGVTSVFDQMTADFSPIVSGETLWLDTVQHAARVSADETGVEAAAYTVMMTVGAAMPPDEEMDFVLDRPFLFLITSGDNLPLFAGVVNNP